MTFYLKHIEGSKKGEIQPFDRERIRIGRRPDNDLKFDPDKEKHVHGYHAEIYWENGTFFIRNLPNAVNGTSVNALPINQPTLLSDGDIIQLAPPRGPKLVFSSRDPSSVTDGPAGPETLVIKEEQVSPLPPPPRKTFAWNTWVIASSAGAIFLAFSSLAYAIGWPWWTLLVLPSSSLMAALAGLLAWRWWSARREPLPPSQEAFQDEGRQPDEAKTERGNIVELRQKCREALQTLRGSKLRQHGDDPVYAFPWFIILGKSGSGKTVTVRAGHPHPSSSVSRSKEASRTRNCDWWFFDSAVILDTTGRYAVPSTEEGDEAEWRELLSLLKNGRWREPINGAIVVVGVDSLAFEATDKLREQASQLRRRLDEMVRRLGTSFPVYLVITKCDVVPGFTEFFGTLPERVWEQAMGCSLNQDRENPAGATSSFDQGFRLISERLDHLRLALMENEEDPGTLRKFFLFPEEFRVLRVPLRTFVETLFRQTPYHETPFFKSSPKIAGITLRCQVKNAVLHFRGVFFPSERKLHKALTFTPGRS